ncbi:unnamed protein product [Sphagnum balticum]
MEKNRCIKVTGAREHNLKNVSVEIPKDSLTVITGPSGSGKSTLALDILYAEGQRRYIESLSSYARQFLGNPHKPDVDKIEGLCPAIAINQKTVGSNPRSTIGTMTEIYDYLRVLFARIGHISCPTCKKSVQAASPASIARAIREQFPQEMVLVAAPIAIERKGEFIHEIEELFKAGYYRFIIDARTISGGEGQRIRLATQLGSALSGVLYILDEPSIGLHQRDNDRLITTLKKLRDLGNTVVVVEHDHDTMLASDHLIDMGPAAGRFGGAVVAAGSPHDFVTNPSSLTGDFLSGKRAIVRGREIRTPVWICHRA